LIGPLASASLKYLHNESLVRTFFKSFRQSDTWHRYAVLSWNEDVQESIRGFDVRLSWINFFGQDVYGYHVWPIARLSNMACVATKNNQAVSRQAQNSSYLRIPRTLNDKMKCRGVSIKVVTQQFLLGSDPVIQVETMYAATVLEKLVGPSGDCRLDDLLVLFVSTLDRNYPVVSTLLGTSLHSRTSLPISHVSDLAVLSISRVHYSFRGRQFFPGTLRND
jgi:hypothetical protein